MSKTPKRSRRPTIGFLVDALFDGFQERIWNGITDATRSLDVNLLCFLSGSLWHKQIGDSVDSLISEKKVDGLVILSGSLGCYIGEEQLALHYRRLPHIPIVNISKPVGELPSVLVDNETGMRELMEHLVGVHGRRRIAFIRGPETNSEAEARFKAYRESLDRAEIRYEPELVFLGDFERNSGIRAIRAFLDERRVEFDAVVGANDYMAIHAMKDLQRRGRRVPEDVLVAGFDDTKDATSTSPLLTTVRQPLYEMGREAVRKTLALIKGEPISQATVLPTSLVVRRSCGCIRPTDGELLRLEPSISGPRGNGIMSRQKLAKLLERTFPEGGETTAHPSWAERLTNGIYDDLEGAPGSFLPVLENLFAEGFKRRLGADYWHKVLGAAFGAVRRGTNRRGVRAHAEDLWKTSLLAVGKMVEQAQTSLRLRSEEEFRILPRVSIIGHLDEAEIKQVIVDEFPALGIQSFYLSRYTDETREYASLYIHFSFSDHVTLDPSTEHFRPGSLVPGSFTRDHRYSYAVFPLQSRSEPIGFALCEMDSLSGAAYETLITQLSAALKVSSLIGQVKRHASELEAKVKERTSELRAAQQQLVEAAHQGGMAEVAVGLMHNLGNLLNSVNVSAEEIENAVRTSRIDGLVKLNELLQFHEGDLVSFFAQDPKAKIMPSYLGKVTESLRAERARIQSEIGQLLSKTSLIRETIGALQEYAKGGRDMYLYGRIDIPTVVESALKINEVHLSEHNVSVRKDISAVQPVVTQPAKVVHVLVNVIKNAAEAMRSAPEGKRFLTIQVRPGADGGVLVRISDTGVGISPQNLKRLFSYGFTTKPEGHGFGLHTCANHMSQMGGSISVESPGEGQGTTFTMVFSSKS